MSKVPDEMSITNLRHEFEAMKNGSRDNSTETPNPDPEKGQSPCKKGLEEMSITNLMHEFKTRMNEPCKNSSEPPNPSLAKGQNPCQRG